MKILVALQVAVGVQESVQEKSIIDFRGPLHHVRNKYNGELVQKRRQIEVNGYLVSLINSYISERPRNYILTAGVLEGSVSGPMLCSVIYNGAEPVNYGNKPHNGKEKNSKLSDKQAKGKNEQT